MKKFAKSGNSSEISFVHRPNPHDESIPLAAWRKPLSDVNSDQFLPESKQKHIFHPFLVVLEHCTAKHLPLLANPCNDAKTCGHVGPATWSPRLNNHTQRLLNGPPFSTQLEAEVH